MANHGAILADDQQRDVVEPDGFVHGVFVLGEPRNGDVLALGAGLLGA